MTTKWDVIIYSIFEYYTPKIVLIRNKTVGILNRVVQLLIISYIFGYAIIYNKGYQEFSEIESAITTKVKGVAFTNFSKDEFNELIPDVEVYHRIWDTSDYVIPPQESNAFFVVTNIVVTSNQTQSTCPEDPAVPDAQCTSDSQCHQGVTLITGNGIMTGSCVFSDIDPKVKVCEIIGWCPVERDINPLKNNEALLTSTKNFTVLIKNFVDFPKFNIRRSNIPDFADPDYLKHCVYDPVSNKLCPVFILEDIVPGNYDEIAVRGAAVAVLIKWDCNFDYSSSYCFPTYEFRRLDDNATIAPGLNFRYAHFFGEKIRTMYKAYGVKFLIMPQGRAGKFHIVPLLLNIGSGLGLLALATILCDIVVLHIVKRKEFYKSVKYQSASAGESINNIVESGNLPSEEEDQSVARIICAPKSKEAIR